MKIIVFAAYLVSTLAHAQSPLTNADVIRMVTYGISPMLVKTAINKSKPAFDLSTDGLIQLKKSGLNDDIVMSMLLKLGSGAPATTKDSFQNMVSGIYYQSQNNRVLITPDYLTNPNVKGLGAVLKKSFGGFISLALKVSIAGPHSSMEVKEKKPVYLFILDDPAEFFLIRLRGIDSARKFSFEKPANGAGQININDSLKYDYNIRKIESGCYEISPVHPLPVGEYGFIYSSAAFYSGTRFKIFDFRILDK